MLDLSEIQENVLIGTVLGDGSLEFNDFQGVRLQIKQREDRKEYVWWMYDHFKDFTSTPPQKRTDTDQWYFGTRYLKEFKNYFDLFYPDGKKVVPDDISEYLTSPLSLAVWYMDDGTLDYRPKSHYAYSLSTDSFKISEVEILKDMMEENFGVKASVQTPSSRGTKYPKLYIGSKGRDRFKSLIEDYLLECFDYKLPPEN